MAENNRGTEDFRNQKGKKQYIELEKRYQDSLEVTTSMTSGLNRLVSDNIDQHVRRNRTSAQYQATIKGINSKLTDAKSVNTAIAEIETTRRHLQMDMSKVSGDFYNKSMQTLTAMEEILKTQQKQLQVINMVDGAQKSLTESINGSLDGFKDTIETIPLFGKLFGNLASGPIDTVKQSISDAGKTFVSDFAMKLGEGATGMEALGFAGTGAMEGLALALNPVTLGIVAVVAALAAGIVRFTQIDSAAKQFRESTGLLNSQTKGLQKNIQTISTDMAGLGVSAEQVAEAAGEFTNEFGGLEQPAKGTLESMVMLNKNFGIGFSEASKLNKVFQNMGNLTEAQAQSMTNSVVEMSKMAGVAPSKVVADIANNSEIAYKYFRGGPKELAKAAVSLAAMGSSLESAAKSSESLLDFENSITSELEASAMLGKQLNFDKARTAAFNGDLYGQEKAIMEQLQGIGDISKMNVYQKEALTKATGKEVSELLNLQRIQERFPNLDETRLAAANALLDTGQDISKLTEADLDAQTQRMAKEKEMQSVMDDLSNKVSAMGTGLMDAFLPLAQVAIPLVGYLIDIFGGFVKGIIQPIGNAFSRIFEKLKPIGDLFSKIFGGSEVSILSKTFEIIGNILVGPILFALNFAYGLFQSIVDVVSGLADIIMGIITLDFSRMGKGFLSVFEGVLGFIFRIPMAIYRTIVDIFPSIGTAFSDFFTGIAGSLKGFFTDMLPDWAKDWLNSGKSDTSAIQKEAVDGALGMDSSGYKVVDDSINDGIVQNGKVISTNPKDTLIATQNPSQLAGGLGDDSFLGNLMNGFSSAASAIGSIMTPDALKFDELITEIKGLRADLTGGKVGVNMDGKKVTAGVSRVVTQTTGNAYALK
jgi:hypothetical protein